MKFTEIDRVEGQMANIPMVFQVWEYQGIMQEPCDLRAYRITKKICSEGKLLPQDDFMSWQPTKVEFSSNRLTCFAQICSAIQIICYFDHAIMS